MWIVRLALRRPYTFVVAAILLLILGPVAILRTPTDIFPNINIPVVSVIWNYGGLEPEEMSNRITYIYERVLTTTVNDIEHIESQSFNGIGIIEGVLSPGRADWKCGGANYRGFSNHRSAISDRNYASPGNSI